MTQCRNCEKDIRIGQFCDEVCYKLQQARLIKEMSTKETFMN